MNIAQQIKRLGLMATYATRVVHDEGLSELYDSKVYRPLLKTAFLSTDSDDDYNSMSWSTCTRLDMLIDGVCVYITLVEWSEVEISPEYDWYKLKSEVDQCSAVINIKRKLRDMIKNPQKYFHIDCH